MPRNREKKVYPLWESFEKLPGKIAKCKQCSKILSYRTTSTNLKVHLINKHYDFNERFLALTKPRKSQPKQVESSVPDDHNTILMKNEFIADIKQAEKSLDNPNILWYYFSRIDNQNTKKKMAKCIQCSKIIKCEPTSNLKSHLKCVHKDCYERFLIFSKPSQKNKVQNWKVPNSFDNAANESKPCSIQMQNDSQDKSNSFLNKNKQHKIQMKCTQNIDENQLKENILFQYFSKVAGKIKVAKCKLCYINISYRFSNVCMIRHLSYKHVVQYNAFQAAVQECKTLPFKIEHIKEEMSPIKTKKQNKVHTVIPELMPSKHDEQIDSMLMKFIIKTYQQYKMVEEHDFKTFVHALNPQYVLPSSKNLSHYIVPNLYNKCAENQMKILEEAVTICLSSFCFTSVKLSTCVCITAHFVNDNYEFKSVLLKWHGISDASTSQNLATILRDTCLQWDIFKKIRFCITDNTENLIEAVHSLGWKHGSCVFHTLNHILQDSLSMIDDTLLKIKKIVLSCQSNFNLNAKLSEYQAIKLFNQLLGYISSVPTRWTSNYHTITHFVPLEEAVRTMSDHINLPVLSRLEWTILRQLSKVLKPFNEAVKELSSEKYLCASKGIAIVCGLKDIISELKNNEDFYDIMCIIEFIEENFITKFYDLENEENWTSSIILDPRYKLSMFTDENIAEQAKSRLVNKVFSLRSAEADLLTADTEAIERDEEEMSLWRRRNIVLEKEKLDPSQKLLRQAQQEVEFYLQEDYESNSCNPSDWWRCFGQYKYPHLCKLFITCCNLVATLPNQRQTFTERKLQLPLKQTEQLVFLNFNTTYLDFKRIKCSKKRSRKK